MQKLAEICVRRPVLASVIILVLCVFGVFGFLRLGVDRFPTLEFPIVTVRTVLPGAAPTEVESQVTDKIEEAVNTVSGIEELRSRSSEGVSQVFITFVLEKDPNVAAQEVRDKISLITAELPEDADPPTVEKLGTESAPVMTVSLSGPATVRELTEYADRRMRRQLETVLGVGQIEILGGQKRQINVDIDPLKLRAQGVTVTDVRNALLRNNVEIPGGVLKSGPAEYTLRTPGRVVRPEELQVVPVAQRGKHVVLLEDVAKVSDSSAEPTSVAKFNEDQTVLLNVRKQSGANTVFVVDSVAERVEDMKQTLPSGWRADVVRDQAVFVKAAIHSVEEHLILGSILASIVVLFFLRSWRATIISAVAIPASIISTFAVVWYMGYSLNLITLLALTLSVGIVIDDAIVVLENIVRFIDEKGMTPFQAAVEATREIGPAVLAITLSLIAVFLPVAFMSGIVGKFMSSFGVTMASAILVSMLVSFTLTPMLSARLLKGRGRAKANGDSDEALDTARETTDTVASVQENSSHGSGPIFRAIESGYTTLLAFALRHRWLVVVTCIASLATIPFLFGTVGKNFLPDDDEGDMEISVTATEGTSLEAMDSIMTRMARDVRSLAGVDYTVMSIGGGGADQANRGNIYVKLVDVSQRSFSQTEIMQYVRENVMPKYESQKLRTSVARVEAISGGGQANALVQLVIAGPDIVQLASYAAQLKEVLRNTPGAVDVDSTLELGKPEFRITINRSKAADLGVSVEDISSAIRLLVAGDVVGTYAEGSEQYDVFIRSLAKSRRDVALLQLITVPSSQGQAVSLADVTTIESGTAPAVVNRLNRQREVTVTCNVAPGFSQQDVIAGLERGVAELKLSPEYKTAFLGQSKELGKAALAFVIVFLTAFIFMYLVIAAQFESWIHPVTILLSLPLTLPFALVALILFNESLNIFSMLGLLVLFAVVKKNSILQIDHTNQLRARGMERNAAILAANRDRLRPILMTTVAFVAGMLPLLFGTGAGAGTNKTISSLIIGGQTLSLLLTLVATPIAYSLFDDLIQKRPVARLLRLVSAPFRALRPHRP